MMKMFSTLIVLLLTVPLPILAAEIVPEVPNPAGEEVLVTPMEPVEPTENLGMAALVGETGFVICMFGDPNYCESDADCTWPCTCNISTNCCYGD